MMQVFPNHGGDVWELETATVARRFTAFAVVAVLGWVGIRFTTEGTLLGGAFALAMVAGFIGALLWFMCLSFRLINWWHTRGYSASEGLL